MAHLTIFALLVVVLSLSQINIAVAAGQTRLRIYNRARNIYALGTGNVKSPIYVSEKTEGPFTEWDIHPIYKTSSVVVQNHATGFSTYVQDIYTRRVITTTSRASQWELAPLITGEYIIRLLDTSYVWTARGSYIFVEEAEKGQELPEQRFELLALPKMKWMQSTFENN